MTTERRRSRGTARAEPLLPDGALLALLVLDGVLLGAAGLAFTPLYLGGVPAPLGALASIALLPWLVGRAAEIDPRPGGPRRR